jgi:hypothetical protein
MFSDRGYKAAKPALHGYSLPSSFTTIGYGPTGVRFYAKEQPFRRVYSGINAWIESADFVMLLVDDGRSTLNMM